MSNENGPVIIDLTKVLTDSLKQLCACGHRRVEHRGQPWTCARAGCGCERFRAPESEEERDDA